MQSRFFHFFLLFVRFLFLPAGYGRFTISNESEVSQSLGEPSITDRRGDEIGRRFQRRVRVSDRRGVSRAGKHRKIVHAVAHGVSVFLRDAEPRHNERRGQRR